MSGPPIDPQDPGPTGAPAAPKTNGAPAPAPGQALTAPAKLLPPAETNSSAMAAREKAAIEARALVAMHRPRDFELARQRILRTCQRPRFAKVAKYSKPVGAGKRVDGLSIRFAEEIRVQWGNIDVSAFLVFDDETRRVYRVQGVDLETNASDSVDIMVEKQVERKQPRDGDDVLGERINSKGEKVFLIAANEDALLTKVNNLIAKARRNVILTLIPGDIKEEAEETIDQTVKDRDAKDPEGAKKDVMDGFFGVGVVPAQIVEFLGHPLETLNPAELHVLRRVFVGIRDGESTWEEVMVDRRAGGKPAGDDAKKGTAGLKEKLGGKKRGEPEAKAAGDTAGAPKPDAAAGASPASPSPASGKTQEELDLEEDARIVRAEEEGRKL